jgi:V-type H+-transporting ATPase subunit E
VTLNHRPKDAETVKKAAKTAQDKYKEISGRESKIEFAAELNDDSAGGVVGSSLNGRIRVNNTLEERLHILEEKVSLVCAPEPLGTVAHVRCCPS